MRTRIVTFVLAALTATSAFAGTPDWASAEKRWETSASVTGNPGIAYAVVKDGKVVRMGAIGYTAADPVARVTPQTRFYIASVTKPFVALTLVELAQRKKVDLDAPVVRYLPQFDLADHEYARQVTIRDLMSHRAGLHSDYLTTVSAYLGRVDDESFFAALRELKPTKKFRYSNLNYLILGRVIERVSGKPWASMVQQLVLKPLHMNATTADVSVLQAPGSAVPLMWNGISTSIAPARKTQSTMNAAGGLISTASDLAKLLQDLTGHHPRLITDEVAHQLFAKDAEVTKGIAFIQRSGYGLGWYIGGLDDKPLIHHFGSFVGAHIHLSFSPEDRIGVAVLANEDTPIVHAIAADIYSLMRTGKFDNKVEFVQGLLERYAKKMRGQPQTSASQPPVPAGWIGRYQNPTFGDATITLQGVLSLGAIQAPLRVEGNGFRVSLGDDSLAGTVSVKNDGTELELLVEGHPLRFERR